MPKFRITDPKTGRRMTVSGDREPTQEEAAELFANEPSIRRTARNIQPTPSEIAAQDTAGLKQGAPIRVRARVDTIPREARLSALQQHFPDAAPFELLGAENFVYSDPESGEGVLYNPIGPDLGDVPSALPVLGEAVGGTLGAASGAAIGAPNVPRMVAGGMAGAGTGATAGREFIERSSMALQGIEDPRTAFEQAISAGTTFAINAFGQGVGAMAKPAAEGFAQSVARGFGSRSATEKAIADLARFGEVPSWGGSTDRAAIDSLEGFMANIPGGAGVVRDKAASMSENIARSISAKVSALTGRNRGTSPIQAGETITEGVETFARNFSDSGASLYNIVDGHIPSYTGTDVSRTIAALDEVTAIIPGAEETSAALRNKKLVEIATGLRNDIARAGANAQGVIPWGAVKDLRSAVGRKLGTVSLVEDIPRAELKRVYAALTADMRIAAQAQGPEALKAFDRATQYYRAGMKRIDDMLEPLIQDKMPARVFAAVERSARDGPQQVKALRQSVTPHQWRIIAGTMIERLGVKESVEGSVAAQFDMNTFLRNYQSLRQAARGDEVLDALFSGPGMGTIKQDLDALARAANRMKRSSQAFSNPAGTARNVIGGAMLLGALYRAQTGDLSGVLLAGVGVAGANRAATLMTSPKFVKWLAQSPNVKPNGVGAYIGRLTAIALSSDADTRDAIEEYARDLSQIGTTQ